MELRRPRRTKRSLNLDTDMADWLAARAQAASANQSTIVRQILRAVMQAESKQHCDGAAA